MRRNVYMKIVVLSAVAFFCSGCFVFTTRDDGEKMKQELAHLQDRLVKLEKEAGAHREDLEEMIGRAQTQVEAMEETLSKATRVLARNSADFGAEMDEVKNELNGSKGAAAEINHEFELLKKDVVQTQKKVTEFALAAGLDLPVDESIVPTQAIDHLNMIKDSLSKGRYGEVRSLAKVYQNRYPRARNMDEVQLIIGKSYIAQKRHAKALGTLRRFADLYPKSRLMPEVLYEMSNAFYQLGDCTDARILVDVIISRHKKSPFVAKALQLKETLTASGAKCTS